MSALFIVTVLLLAAVAYRIFRKQQELNSYRADRAFRPSAPQSLFDAAPDREEAEQHSAEESARVAGELNS